MVPRELLQIRKRAVLCHRSDRSAGVRVCVGFRHEIALERIAEIEEILEGFNDEHKSMILGEDAQEIL
jgi:hypothetical protein